MNFIKKHLLIMLILTIPLLFADHDCHTIQASSKMDARYLKPVFKKTKLRSNIEYGQVINSEGKNQKLLLDIYFPDKDTEENRPAIVWIHGGAFSPQFDKTKDNIVALAKEFATRGYVSISIDYRLRKKPFEDFYGMINDTIDDTMLSIEWIRKNAEKYGIDKNQIIVGGTSSGGQVAVYFCYKDQRDNDGWDKTGIIGLIDLWGPVNLKDLVIDKNDPPTIIVHGTNDNLVPFAQSESLAEELKNQGVPYLFYPLEGADHNPMNLKNKIADKIAEFLYDLLKK